MMLQQQRPEDFVVATSETHSLEEFVAEAFGIVGLSWRNHVVFDPSLPRPSDIAINCANPTKAHKQLGWQAHHNMKDVVRMMVEARR